MTTPTTRPPANRPAWQVTLLKQRQAAAAAGRVTITPEEAQRRAALRAAARGRRPPTTPIPTTHVPNPYDPNVGPIRVYPPGGITPYGAKILAAGVEPNIQYVSGDGAITWHLHGGMAPIPGIQQGAFLADGPGGLHPPFTFAEHKGARQDGVTTQHVVFDPAEIDLTIELTSPSNYEHPELAAANMRRVVRDWIESWDPRNPGILTWTTNDFGRWWCTPRLFRSPPDKQFKAQARRLRQKYTWTIRNDDAFWRGVDSISEFK